MTILRSKKKTISLNIMPLIDVVFQLLVFFMLTSSFLTPAIKLNLPRAITQDEKDKNKIVLSINNRGEYFLRKRKIAADDLTDHLRTQLADVKKKVIDVRGDENMPYKAFVKAMDCSRQAGAVTINLLHDSE